MLKAIAKTMLDSAEKELGVPVDEMRYVLEHSMHAFRTFSSVRGIADYRRTLPADVYYVAKIAAYRQENPHSCLQIATNKARKHELPDSVIQAARDGKVEALSPELQRVFRFAEDQANRKDNPATREWLRERYGDEGLIELAIGIASARLFPAFKRTLGYAASTGAATP